MIWVKPPRSSSSLLLSGTRSSSSSESIRARGGGASKLITKRWGSRLASSSFSSVSTRPISASTTSSKPCACAAYLSLACCSCSSRRGRWSTLGKSACRRSSAFAKRSRSASTESHAARSVCSIQSLLVGIGPDIPRAPRPRKSLLLARLMFVERDRQLHDFSVALHARRDGLARLGAVQHEHEVVQALELGLAEREQRIAAAHACFLGRAAWAHAREQHPAAFGRPCVVGNGAK